MEILIQQLINGIALGSIYALIALGYTMVYGIIQLINFAHGDIYMVGAFVAFFLISIFHLFCISEIIKQNSTVTCYPSDSAGVFLISKAGKELLSD